jgi:transposase-like protein
MENKSFDYDGFEKKTIAGIKEGKEIFGKEGLFTPLLKQFLEKCLEAELEEHLQQEQSRGNKRNGKSSKMVRSTCGSFDLVTPRDRKGTFQPQAVGKRQVFLGDDMESKILSLYGKGNSYSQVRSLMEEFYGLRISEGQISEITNKIIPELEEWQARPLQKVYTFVWFDAIHFKVRINGVVESRALYNVLALNRDGNRELLGLFVSESESSKFWLQVMEDLQNRGVEDILIICTDNLSGFSEAISSVYPKSIIQSCIVHQIRNSTKYVVYKDRKEFAGDLKTIYKATTVNAAEEALGKAEEKWKHKYGPAFKSWRKNWSKLSSFFDFSKDIRRIMYTTNAIEGVHRQMRSVTKTKGAFSSEMALKKLIYLRIKEITKNWKGKQANWGLVLSQLEIKFGDRICGED